MYRVLIVEDEDIIRKGIIFMMSWEKAGCVVVGEASDGKEGLEMIDRLGPDIVVSDIRMPVKNGLEMLQESIEEGAYEAILISGFDDFQYAQTAIGLGVREYLLKPVDFKKLAASIGKITKKLDGERQTQQYLEQAINGVDKEALLRSEWLLPGSVKNRYIDSSLEYIRNHYKQKVSLTEFASIHDISASYLNTKFKTATGYTFNDFLNRYRIMKAVEYLQRPDLYLRVYEVAEEVGFSDYKYFNKVFKKYIGHPPFKFLSSNSFDVSGPQMGKLTKSTNGSQGK